MRCSVTPTRTDVVVETAAGPVRGVRGRGITRFGGVPYARADRFDAPHPARWTAVLDATHRGPVPPQDGSEPDLVPGMDAGDQAEDCLRAEIWTPSVDGRLPVLAWVPGGGYRTGGASLATYDGVRLATRSTVVVGINYRLGALGWLAADGVPTNLGLRDLIAAVSWLRENAPAFGGDPGRIVLMGESAGAGLIAHALAARIDGVAGAIVQSGAPAATLDTSTVEWVADRFFEAAGARDARAVRALPVDAVVRAQEQAAAAALGKVGKMPFHPWVDGELLRAAPIDAELSPVPLVVGTNADEMELFRDQVPALAEDVAARFLARKAAVLGITDESLVRTGLRACDGDLVEAVADLDLHVPNELLARAHRARGNRVWRYRFTWQAGERGAFHALDLPFSFGTLDVAGWRDFAGAQDARADALSTRMQTAWTSFADGGVPRDDALDAWPAHSLVQLGAESAVGEDAISRRVDLWLSGRGRS
jgi:para-nitrobenzyl esterase